MHGLYASVKGEICCTLSDSFVIMWAVLTALGYLLIMASVFAMGVLAALDELPGAGACCGCRFLTPGRMEAIADENGQSAMGYGGAARSAPSAGGDWAYNAPRPVNSFAPHWIPRPSPAKGY